MIKVGGDFEAAETNFDRGYTGGQFWSRSANTAAGAPGRWTVTEFDKVVRTLQPGEDPNLMAGELLCVNDNAVCSTTRSAKADVNNRNFSAYIQDSWNVRPNLTLDAGLRWERQIGYVGEGLAGTKSPEGLIIPDKGYELPNLIAPRLGFIFDPTKEGKSKVFGHWGRFFENVPMDLNARSFGGEITNQQVYNQNRFTTSSGSYDPNCDVNHGTMDPVGTLRQCSDKADPILLGGGSGFVAPSLKGQYTDELVLGTEYEIMADVKVGLNYVHRNMPRVIEDMYWSPTGEYTIVNPGEDFHADAEELRAKAAAETDPTLKQLYTDHADQLDYAKRFAKPIRNYDAIQLTATQRPTKSSLILASYTFSQSRGNYPGLFSTETLQDDPNITSLYDLPELMANRYGPMGLDRPHNVKFDGFYMFDFKKAGGLTTGVSLRAQSGIPHNALAAHPFYGIDESYVLPRGALERSPVTTNVDIHLAYGYRINKTTELSAFVRVFNLFNTQHELDRDETYTFDNALPIVNGTPDDLKHLKAVDENGNETNTTPSPNKNFGHLNSLTAPRSMQLGFRLTF